MKAWNNEETYTFEELDLIESRLCVVLGTLHHLEGDKPTRPTNIHTPVNTSLHHLEGNKPTRPTNTHPGQYLTSPPWGQQTYAPYNSTYTSRSNKSTRPTNTPSINTPLNIITSGRQTYTPYKHTPVVYTPRSIPRSTSSSLSVVHPDWTTLLESLFPQSKLYFAWSQSYFTNFYVQLNSSTIQWHEALFV